MEVPTKEASKTWNSEKEKMKTLGTGIFSSRTNSDDEIRIRITLCLSSSNLIDDNWILHTTYSSWKGLRSDISQT